MAIKDILTTLEDALKELVTLEIVTSVGAVQPTTPSRPGESRAAPALDAGAKMMRTRVDLVRSGVTTEIDPAFVSGEYQGLRQFHADREKLASDMVKSHVETIKSIIALIEGHAGKGA